MKIENFSGIQQDTLIFPQQQNRSLPTVNVQRPTIDLERADEIIRQFEQREQEIIQLQEDLAKPKPKPVVFVEKSAIEADTVLMRDNLPTSIQIPITESSAVTNGISSEERLAGYPSSITLFIISGCALLIFIKYRFRKNMVDAFQSLFNYRQFMRIFEERRESDKPAFFLSNVLFLWITGIFVSLALPFFGAGPLWGNYALTSLFFSAAIGWLFIMKALTWNILGFIFMVQSFSKIYIYNMFSLNRITGWMIFPFVVMIPYVTVPVSLYIVYIVIIEFALSYLLRILRIFQIIHGLNVSVFYFILYLCALEILPLLLFVKGCKMLWEFNLFL